MALLPVLGLVSMRNESPGTKVLNRSVCNVCYDTFLRDDKPGGIFQKQRPGAVHHLSFESLHASVSANCYLCLTMWKAYEMQGYDPLQLKDQFSSRSELTRVARATITLNGEKHYGFQVGIMGTTQLFRDRDAKGQAVYVNFLLGEMKVVGECSFLYSLQTIHSISESLPD